MQFSKEEMWMIYDAVNHRAAYSRMFNISAKRFEKLADKIEKELLK